MRAVVLIILAQSLSGNPFFSGSVSPFYKDKLNTFYFSTNATNQTTSTSFVGVPFMSNAPGVGKYYVTYTALGVNSLPNTVSEIAIFTNNGLAVLSFGMIAINFISSVSMSAVITVPNNVFVNVRFRSVVGVATISLFNHNFTILERQP